MQKFNPGDIAPKTGRYCVMDKNGRCLDTISCDEGNRLPPTQSSEYWYELED